MNQITNKLKQMKNLSYLLIFFLAIGCADLDLSPTDMIAEDAVKKDPKLVEAFLTKIYANANFEPNEGGSKVAIEASGIAFEHGVHLWPDHRIVGTQLGE